MHIFRHPILKPSTSRVKVSKSPFYKGPNWCLPGAHRVDGELGTNPSLSSKKIQFSIVKISFFRIFAKKKSPPLVSQITTLYRAPPPGKNGKNLLDHCSFSEKVISQAPRPPPAPALQGAEGLRTWSPPCKGELKV